MSIATDIVKRRLSSEMERARALIRSDLAMLSARICNAIAALDDGRKLDDHLIANMSMVTADIARWNLTIDLLPILESE